MQMVLVIFFQMPGLTYRKAKLKSTYNLISKKSWGESLLGLVSCSFFCIYNLCIFKIDFKAQIVMQMLKQKRSYIETLYGKRGLATKQSVPSVCTKNQTLRVVLAYEKEQRTI